MDRQVAFVTYKKHPEITEDDTLAAKALAQLGIDAVGIPWDIADVDWSHFAAVVLRSCWDYFHHPERFLSWIDSLNDQGAMLLNGHSIVRWNAEKTYLADLLKAGVRIVPTIYAHRGSDASISSMLVEHIWERAVIKPTISGTSMHTWVTDKVGAKTSLQNDQLQLNSLLKERSMMLQEFFPEIETEGELSLIYFDGVFSHAVRKVPQAGDFRVQNEFGGSWNPIIPNETVKLQADSILRASGCDAAYARVDGVVRGDTLFLMELEMIEPHLFLSAHPAAAERFALSIANRAGAHLARGAVRTKK